MDHDNASLDSDGSDSQRQLEASSSGKGRSKASKPATVEIAIVGDTEPMVSGVNGMALLRFGREAMRDLPRDSPTSETDGTPERLAILPVGEIAPTHSAFNFVADWMEANVHLDKPDTFNLSSRQMSGKLIQPVNVLAVALALDCPMAAVIGRHVAMITETLQNRPITKEGLEAMWTLLPKNHWLIDTAISSLTTFWLRGKVSADQTKELGDYFLEDEELKRRFAREGDVQRRRRALQ